MKRTLLWLAGGVVLGAIIHIAVILSLPALSSEGIWPRIQALDALNRVVVLPPPEAGKPNPLRLDPEFAYAVCQIDLRNGPGTVAGTLPQAFWSIAVYSRTGSVLYSTTNRDGIGQALDLGIFNDAQTRLLAEQTLDVGEGLLIVESRVDDIFVLVRLSPAHPVMMARYAAALERLSCGNMEL